MSSLQTRAVLRVLLIITAFGIGLWALYRLASVVFVLILATLVAYLLAPLVERAEGALQIAGQRPPRWAAITLVYVLIGTGVAVPSLVLLPSASQQVGDMVALAPAYAQSIVTWEHGWTRYYDRLRLPIELRHVRGRHRSRPHRNAHLWCFRAQDGRGAIDDEAAGRSVVEPPSARGVRPDGGRLPRAASELLPRPAVEPAPGL